MRIRALNWRRYRIPLVAPFTTTHGVLRERVGLLLRLETDAGLVGLGEAAPLPGFGGDLVAAEAALRSAAPSLIGLPLERLPDALESLPEVPAVRCALDTAAIDVEGQAMGKPVAALLAKQWNEAVPVTATVGTPLLDDALTACRAAVAAGFGFVKLKVGVAGSPAAEIERIAAVREALPPAVALRLDANGAWSVAEALAVVRAVAPLGIELIEQPVAASDLAGLARVRAAGLVPVAADEALTDLAAAQRVVALGAADVLVVKPMLAGGLHAGRAILELAERSGLGAIVTTTIDTGIGVAAALQLAATLPDQPLACGLATGSLLAGDLVTGLPQIASGSLRLPRQCGLGVVKEPQAAQRWTGYTAS